MVIQRRWKSSSSSSMKCKSPAINSSPEAIQNSCYDFTKTTTSTGENVLFCLKERLNDIPLNTLAAACPTRKTLELLRLNIQAAFDKDIEEIVNKYKDKYILPAARNIRENIGDKAVSEIDINNTIYKMLELSQKPYQTFSTSSNSNSLFELSESDSSTDEKEPAITDSLLFQNKPKTTLKRNPTEEAYGVEETIPSKKLPYNSSEILHSTLTLNRAFSSTRSKTITWNTSAINQESKFVFDFQANKLFNVIDLRDRLTSKYPELIRYCPDNEDRDLLAAQKLISPLTKNGKFVLLVFEELVNLAQSIAKYQALNLEDLQWFKLPEATVKKMHKQFTELSIKNQGIRTNSGYFDTINSSQRSEVGLRSSSASMISA